MKRAILAASCLMLACASAPAQISPVFNSPQQPWFLGRHLSTPQVGNCPAAQAFFARAASNIAAAPTTFTPSIATWESAVEGLICGQVSAGTWASKDIEYFLAAPSEALAEMNLVSSSNTLSKTGATVFDPNVGSYRNTAGSFYDTGYNPSTGHMTSSSAYLAICQLTSSSGGDEFGELDAGSTTGMLLAPNGNGGPFFVTKMQGTGQGAVNSLGTQGGFAVSRTGSANFQSYFDGSPVGPLVASTGGIVGGTTFYLLGANVAGAAPALGLGTVGLAAAGAGETAAQVSADHALFSAALATMLIQGGC